MACAREAKNNEPFIRPQLVLTSQFSMIVSSLQVYGCDLPNTCAGRAGFALDEVMINATTTAKRLCRLQHGYCWVSLLCYITHISPLSCRIKHFGKKKTNLFGSHSVTKPPLSSDNPSPQMEERTFNLVAGSLCHHTGVFCIPSPRFSPCSIP